MYIYSLYGFKLYSQIPLFFLPVYSTQPDPNGELYLEYIQMEIAEASWYITFSRESDEYTLRMGASITYRIHGLIGKCTLEESPDIESDFVIGDINQGYFYIDPEKEKNGFLRKRTIKPM